MLVIKHIEYPMHSEHWSKLEDGSIQITSYCPNNRPQASVVNMKRKQALKNLKRMLREGWLMMVNDLFTNEEL